MSTANPTGIPRLDREEPELSMEEDIPTPANEDEETVEELTDVNPGQP